MILSVILKSWLQARCLCEIVTSDESLASLASRSGWVAEVILDGKINNLQGLRAYAAIAVVVYHTGYVFPHMLQLGRFGVDLFFVISGYIMARICGTNTQFFLRRRLIRIVPPYWLCTILLYMFALYRPKLLLSTHPGPADLFKSLLFVPYYKMGLIRPVLYVGWSLNYEILFYLLVAVSIFLLPRHPLLLTAAFVSAVHFVCQPLAARGAIPDCYSDIRMFEFLLGIAVYEIARRVPETIAIRLRFFSLGALLTSLVCVILLQGRFPGVFQMEWVYMQLLSAFVVLSASLLSQGGWDLRIAWIVLIGDASYILYLVHVYILNLADRVLRQRFHWLHIDEFAGCIAVTALCVVTAVLMHLKLEKPTVAYLNRHFGGHRRTREFSRVRVPSRKVAP